MPSNRRFRATVLLVALVFFAAIYVSSGARQTRDSAFYRSTADALRARPKHDQFEQALKPGGDSAVQRRLREAEEAAKRAAAKKGEEFHGDAAAAAAKKSGSGGGEPPTRPRKVYKDGTEHVLMQPGDEKKGAKKEEVETEEEHEAKVELNYILKRSPSMSSFPSLSLPWNPSANSSLILVIVFSKTYCPYSKKAKEILSKYNILPDPYIVELDEHAIGENLQAELGRTTGRRTVPNVLINGKSIGGGDDIEELHENGMLEEKMRLLGGKRVQVSLKSVKAPRD